MKKKKILGVIIILLIMIALIVTTVVIVLKPENTEIEETIGEFDEETEMQSEEDVNDNTEIRDDNNELIFAIKDPSEDEETNSTSSSKKSSSNYSSKSGSGSSSTSSSQKSSSSKKSSSKKNNTSQEVQLTQKIYNRKSTIGTLYIPKTKVNLKVYSESNLTKMKTMACFLYTTGGLNKKGVTLIVGHNMRNGRLFSNNKKLSKGDVFYFTDYTGKKLKYTIYSKTIKKSSDTSFLKANVDKPVIALSCCTDASNDNRIIILGKAK